MSPTVHAGASLAIGGVVWWATHSTTALVTSVLVGVLLDLDHILDYYRILVMRRTDRVWLFLHSYEGLIPGLLAAHLSGWNPLAIAGVAAFLAHILMDQVSNPVRPLGYFLTFRILKGFRAEGVADFTIEGAYQALLQAPGGRWVVPPLLRRLQAFEAWRIQRA